MKGEDLSVEFFGRVFLDDGAEQVQVFATAVSLTRMSVTARDHCRGERSWPFVHIAVLPVLACINRLALL